MAVIEATLEKLGLEGSHVNQSERKEKACLEAARSGIFGPDL